MSREPAIDWREHMVLVYIAIGRLQRKYPWPRIESEDLVSGHTAILIRCAQKFEPALGYRFSTYAIKSMQMAGPHILRVARGFKRSGNWRHFSLDQSHTDGRGATLAEQIPDPHQGPVDRTMIQKRAGLIADLIDDMPVADRDLIRCTIFGNETQKSYGIRHGVSRSAINQRVSLITKLLARELAQHGITASNRLGAA